MVRLSRRERRKLRFGGKQPELPGSAPGTGPILPVDVEVKEQKQEKRHASVHKPVDSPKRERVYKNSLIRFYDQNYRKLLIIPIFILVFSLSVIVYQSVTTGSFVHKGISLTGGQTITIMQPDTNALELETFLKQRFPTADLGVRVLSEFGQETGVIIDSSLDVSQESLLSALREKVPGLEGNYSVETIGSSLGGGFFEEILLALLVAFLFMSIVVFVLFKTFWPSIAVILAAFSDMAFTVAIIDLFGIKLSTAGIAALLMLIGYSVDTDILLTTRLLKAGRGDYLERTLSSMKTGMTMTLTAIVVSVIAIIFAQSEVLRQIFTILLIGLIADIFNTWIQNVGILWMYMEKKGLKH